MRCEMSIVAFVFGILLSVSGCQTPQVALGQPRQYSQTVPQEVQGDLPTYHNGPTGLAQSQRNITDFFDPYTEIHWRPFYASAYAGTMQGFRLGWDFSEPVGVEYNYGSDLGSSGFRLSLDLDYVSDLDLVFHPIASSRFRPYALVGFGAHSSSDPIAGGSGSLIPLGIGTKWAINDWLALRAEFRDNMTFGQDWRGDTHNLQVTAGLELGFNFFYPIRPTDPLIGI